MDFVFLFLLIVMDYFLRRNMKISFKIKTFSDIKKLKELISRPILQEMLKDLLSMENGSRWKYGSTQQNKEH